MSVSDLADVVEHYLVSFANEQLIVFGICGFPFTGKTALATAVAGQRPRRQTLLLPVESFTLPRRIRKIRGIDGCNPDAYNIVALLQAVGKVKAAKPTKFPQYSWQTGKTKHYPPLETTGDERLLIIDGTVALCPIVAKTCHLILHMAPQREMSWLRGAIRRDVIHRNWSQKNALAQNLSKRNTTRKLYQMNRNLVSISALSICDTLTLDWRYILA